ncbi:MAG: hypothetical protein KJ630_11170 [Proteobacteria bacterium]|nr:hypothetical protein [Pseudomonadota bacterium]
MGAGLMGEDKTIEMGIAVRKMQDQFGIVKNLKQKNPRKKTSWRYL